MKTTKLLKKPRIKNDIGILLHLLHVADTRIHKGWIEQIIHTFIHVK